MRKILSSVKTWSVVLGLSFVLLEAAVRILPFERPPESYFKMNEAKELRSQPWYRAWSKEHASLLRTFKAYEIYGLEPFDGELIKINQDGVRRTIPARAPGLESLWGVKVFGGSTMWGGSVPDQHTTPSYLSAALEADDPRSPFNVSNHGEVGFVFSQEFHRAVRLRQSLPASNEKQVFLFVNGINDVLAALANQGHGVSDPVGKPWEYEKYRYLFQLGKTEISTLDVFKKFKSVRLGLKVAEHLGWKQPDDRNVFRAPATMDLKALAEQVSQNYLRTVEIAHHMLKATGVTPVFVLQPTVSFKSSLSEDEKKLVELNQVWLPYSRTTFELIREKSAKLPHEILFFDESQLFTAETSTMYWDILHYSAEGNRLLGNRLSQIIRQATSQPRLNAG